MRSLASYSLLIHNEQGDSSNPKKKGGGGEFLLILLLLLSPAGLHLFLAGAMRIFLPRICQAYKEDPQTGCPQGENIN